MSDMIEEPRDDSGRPLGMYPREWLGPKDKRIVERYYGSTALGKRTLKAIRFAYQRLVHIHNENPSTDYMIRLKDTLDIIADADEAIAELSEAIKKYGRHDWQCAIGAGGQGDFCTCGLDHAKKIGE